MTTPAQEPSREQRLREIRADAERPWDVPVWQTLFLLADIARLEAALREYGAHEVDCGAVYGEVLTGDPCTCGLDAALDGERA